MGKRKTGNSGNCADVFHVVVLGIVVDWERGKPELPEIVRMFSMLLFLALLLVGEQETGNPGNCDDVFHFF